MKEIIEKIVATRATAADIVAGVMSRAIGKSESELRDEVFEDIGSHTELFPDGWYDPPHGGVAVLCADDTFERLKFDSLRNPTFWPNDAHRYEEGSMGIIYLSPVDRSTCVLGDFGMTFYSGDDESVRAHIRNAYAAIRTISRIPQVGMPFSEIYKRGVRHLKESVLEITPWMRTHADPLGINVGHTVPGSYGDEKVSGSFDEVREAIRSRRIFINAEESFTVPPTGAFTVEARVASRRSKSLPPVFFHFIVTFVDGERRVLEDFEKCFIAAKMPYIL